jgi:hypothetical protein
MATAGRAPATRQHGPIVGAEGRRFDQIGPAFGRGLERPLVSPTGDRLVIAGT